MTGIATNQMAIRDELASGVCLTTDELDKALPNIKRRQLVMAVGKMITKGLAERVERGCYKLTKHGLKTHCAGVKLTSGPNGKHTGPKRPLPNTLLQRAWNVMRISQSFTIPDLVLVAAVDEKNPTSNLQRYVKALVRAGYLLELPIRAKGTALESNGFKRYRLLNDTGEIAPVYRRSRRTVFDHNTNTEIVCRRVG